MSLTPPRSFVPAQSSSVRALSRLRLELPRILVMPNCADTLAWSQYRCSLAIFPFQNSMMATTSTSTRFPVPWYARNHPVH